MDAEFWDNRYAGHTHVWSGEPNASLVTEASDLAPARALDAGCGEGADAIWLASRGWRVTGADFAQAALDKAAAQAAGQGVDVAWVRADLTSWQPAPKFELVTTQFLHVEPAQRDVAYRLLAAAVVPGGTFLVAGHSRQDLKTHTGGDRRVDVLFDPEDVVALLDPTDWTVLVSEIRERVMATQHGPFTATDTVVRALRR